MRNRLYAIVTGVMAFVAMMTLTPVAFPQTKSFDEAVKLSTKEGKPLVVFVGMSAREVPGCVICQVKAIEGEKTGTPYVAIYPNAGKNWRYDEKDATAQAIQDAAFPPPDGSDALDEVNEARPRRGLPPFIKDAGLTAGAYSCAEFRAANLMAGHTRSDFAYLPSGASATAAGCAAWPPALGWGSCCWDGNYTYAGAAWAMGSDGRRYMQIFVR